jgi:ATP-dependent 26S proteasome regulatory subunit
MQMEDPQQVAQQQQQQFNAQLPYPQFNDPTTMGLLPPTVATGQYYPSSSPIYSEPPKSSPYQSQTQQPYSQQPYSQQQHQQPQQQPSYSTSNNSTPSTAQPIVKRIVKNEKGEIIRTEYSNYDAYMSQQQSGAPSTAQTNATQQPNLPSVKTPNTSAASSQSTATSGTPQEQLQSGTPSIEQIKQNFASIPQLKGVDKELVNQILTQLVEKADQIKWQDIAGLADAKQILYETIVLPALRPDIFQGLRSPGTYIM